MPKFSAYENTKILKTNTIINILHMFYDWFVFPVWNMPSSGVLVAHV